MRNIIEIMTEVAKKKETISNIKKEIEDLYKEIISNLPFKVNDKVQFKRPAIDRAGNTIGWITNITFDGMTLNIRYNPPKKDGTRSNKDCVEYIFYHNGDEYFDTNRLTIEVLEPAN